MIHSTKQFAQLAINYCKKNKIKDIVISPGSRNAPLTIGFTNQKAFNCFSIVDERSAAFFALGIAQQTKKPVVLICTSGSALLNYYPAVAEAFYSNIPLIVLSADRPKHLLEIGDGQTIRQENVFANHILQSVTLNDENSIIKNSKSFNQIIKTCMDKNGPVHINIPFDEPLYDTTDQQYSFPEILQTSSKSLLDEIPLEVDFLEIFAKKWNQASKKIVLVGVYPPSKLMQKQIEYLLKDPSVLVLTETTSNIYHIKSINGIDKFLIPLTNKELTELKPDILLTFGGMVVSKKIKQYFRNYKPNEHWHIDKNKKQDTFHCLTQHFKLSAELFFSQFFFLTQIRNSNYQQYFLNIYQDRKIKHQQFLKQAPFSDLKCFDIIFNTLPKNKIQLQLANSSIIRYSQLFDLPNTIEVYCNRGTSGIDGSTSTAVGASIYREEQTIFISGDISFFYDSNALWNKYLKSNFRIILLNNSGGGIFRFIDGPKSTNALQYFETPHNLDAKKICEQHQIEYHIVKNITNLKKELATFYKISNRPKLLEIQTPKDINDLILKEYFTNLKST